MSRLLESLQKAQQERSSKSAEDTSGNKQLERASFPQRGYFWTSLFWLILTCGLIVGGFLLLQYLVYGIEPAQWLDKWLPTLTGGN